MRLIGFDGKNAEDSHGANLSLEREEAQDTKPVRVIQSIEKCTRLKPVSRSEVNQAA